MNPPDLSMLLCCLLLVSAQPAAAVESMTGRPVQVISGNELVLSGSDGTMHRIKLSGIAAQPPNQPWGATARRHLQTLVMGRTVTFVYQRTDRMQEIRGQLRHGGADINIRLLSAGLARLDPTGLSRTEEKMYAEAERRARTTGLGIWGSAGREPRPRYRILPGGAFFQTKP